MKQFIALLLFLAFWNVALAQTNQRTFHLKNGSVVTGVVVEEIPGTSYKVKTGDGNIFVFKADEIEKITAKEDEPKPDKTDVVLQKGFSFYSHNELGFGGIFFDDVSSYYIGLSTTNGIKFNDRIGVGLGLEYQALDGWSSIPYFVDLRMYFPEISMYTFIDIGSAAGGRSDNIEVVNNFGTRYEQSISYTNKFFGRFGLGYKTKISDNLSGTIGLNYSLLSYNANVWLYEDTYLNVDGVYGMFGLKIGIEFNKKLK